MDQVQQDLFHLVMVNGHPGQVIIKLDLKFNPIGLDQMPRQGQHIIHHPVQVSVGADLFSLT